MLQDAEARADDLWLTPDRIGILDTIALDMRCTNFAAIHQSTQCIGNRNLPFEPTHCMDARIERRIAAFDCVSGQGTRAQRRGQQSLRPEQCRKRQRILHLGAIEKRQAFLRRQLYRFQTDTCQRFGSGHRFAAQAYVAYTQHCAGHVGKRGKVAGRTNRPL